MKKKIGFILFLIGFLLIYFTGKIDSSSSKKRAIDEEIIGRVERIQLDVKGIPTIWVNGNDFYLNEFGIPLDCNIEPGDSIFKPYKGFILRHYKRNLNGLYLYKTYKIED